MENSHVQTIEGRSVRPCLTERGGKNLIWLAHTTRPDCWDLVDAEKQFTNDRYCSHRRQIYGWVETKWDGRIHAGGPSPYDQETDSDAWGTNDLPDVEAAMKAVEERYSPDLRI